MFGPPTELRREPYVEMAAAPNNPAYYERYFANLPIDIEEIHLAKNDRLLHGEMTQVPDLSRFTRLVRISFIDMGLVELGELPPNLTHLDVYGNLLELLPAMPTTLVELNCAANLLKLIPRLPSGLINQYCNTNRLKFIPRLPLLLVRFACSENLLYHLPEVAHLVYLDFLYCDSNRLAYLPILPGSITSLCCGRNPMRFLPEDLPDGLTNLNCNNAMLERLPALPANLIWLNVEGNRLTRIPTLPPTLWDLSVSNNRLVAIPQLNDAIIGVNCGNNNLTSFPVINANLIHISYHNNPIVHLVAIDNHRQGWLPTRQIRAMQRFRTVFYTLKFKAKFRAWLWTTVRERQARERYSPENLNAFLAAHADIELEDALDIFFEGNPFDLN